MPFIKLSNSNHRCPLPTTRSDESPLVYGDEWRCDELINTGGSLGVRVACGKIYKWSNDQREGDYWEHQYQR